jgi:DNA-binding transcriptional LysR family regulator
MAKPTIDRRWLPLNALRAFEGVAKHSSFTAAANALLISQSALSRHVIALEKLIGVQLFERKPHALVLTKAGQHLLPAVMKSFDRLEYALDDIATTGRRRCARCACRCRRASRCISRCRSCAISGARSPKSRSIS